MNKIPAIENLGATKDQFDTIDLTDNDIRVLGNFPLLKRLKSLFISNNRINKVEVHLGKNLPNLQTLVLNNNQLSELGDIDALGDIKTLKYLSLMDNPVTKKQHYREYVIHRIPSLRLLDFRKVTEKERLAAKKLFTGLEGSKLVSNLSNQKSKYFEPGITPSHLVDQSASGNVTSSVHSTSKFTPEEAAKIKEAIANAKTLEEANRLERILRSGHIPDVKTSD